MIGRERRPWSANEDQLLRLAVEREDPSNPNPSKWHAIAQHVPNRTNKDCRKRWFAKMASDVVKGGWSPDEDERLVNAIERYGTRWSLVASLVQSRNSDQCAKRWTDTLNPTIDRTTWSPEADATLLQAVQEHGKVWTKIVKTYFPGRTGLSAKNRYNSITRFAGDSSRARSRRKPPDLLSSSVHQKSESVSSSSSTGTSPITPALAIPDMHYPLHPTLRDSSPFAIDSPFEWDPSSFSETVEDVTGLKQLRGAEASRPSSLHPDSLFMELSSFEREMNETLSSFPDDSHIVYPMSTSLPLDNLTSPQFFDDPMLGQQSNLYTYPSQDFYFPSQPAQSATVGSDLPDFTMSQPLPPSVDPLFYGMWDDAGSAVDARHWQNSKGSPGGGSLSMYTY